MGIYLGALHEVCIDHDLLVSFLRVKMLCLVILHTISLRFFHLARLEFQWTLRTASRGVHSVFCVLLCVVRWIPCSCGPRQPPRTLPARATRAKTPITTTTLLLHIRGVCSDMFVECEWCPTFFSPIEDHIPTDAPVAERLAQLQERSACNLENLCWDSAVFWTVTSVERSVSEYEAEVGEVAAAAPSQ